MKGGVVIASVSRNLEEFYELIRTLLLGFPYLVACVLSNHSSESNGRVLCALLCRIGHRFSNVGSIVSVVEGSKFLKGRCERYFVCLVIS